MPREVQSWGFKLLGSLSPPGVPKELNGFDSRGRPFPAFKGEVSTEGLRGMDAAGRL